MASHYRDQLEEQIKNIFTWAIGQSAITKKKDGKGKTKFIIPIPPLRTIRSKIYYLNGKQISLIEKGSKEKAVAET